MSEGGFMGEIITIPADLPIFDREKAVPCFVKGCDEEAHIWVPFRQDDNDLFWRNRKTLEFEIIEKGETTIIRMTLCARHFEEWKLENEISFKAE